MSRLITLRLSDRCTAPEDRRSADLELSGVRVELRGDVVVLDGRVVLRRVDPLELPTAAAVFAADVHWETVDRRRFTHVEIDT